MTRARESGDNEITDEARREAARTGMEVCAILAEMLRMSKQAGDWAKARKIERAQKYLGCRNVRKRRGRP